MTEEKKYRYRLRTLLSVSIITEIAFWALFIFLWILRYEIVPGLRMEHPEWIGYSLALPLITGTYLFMAYRKNRILKRFADNNMLKYISSSISTGKSIIKFILLRVGLALVFIAISDPQIPKITQEEATYQGMDIIIALDVSKSMLAEDLKPNRLERAKMAISQLINGLKGNRIGVIAFAGNVDKVLQLTTDYSFAKEKISSLSTSYISKQGTDIGSAIELALSSFNFDHGGTKAIIVITDGEDHQNGGVQAASNAASMNVSVHMIGVGSPQGSPIPEYKNGKKTGGFKVDNNGETVITKLNINMLNQIASAGKGSAIRTSGSQMGLRPLVNHLNELDKKKYKDSITTSYQDEFQVFLAFGLLLIVLTFFFTERRSKFADKIKLFEE